MSGLRRLRITSDLLTMDSEKKTKAIRKKLTFLNAAFRKRDFQKRLSVTGSWDLENGFRFPGNSSVSWKADTGFWSWETDVRFLETIP